MIWDYSIPLNDSWLLAVVPFEPLLNTYIILIVRLAHTTSLVPPEDLLGHEICVETKWQTFWIERKQQKKEGAAAGEEIRLRERAK